MLDDVSIRQEFFRNTKAFPRKKIEFESSTIDEEASNVAFSHSFHLQTMASRSSYLPDGSNAGTETQESPRSIQHSDDSELPTDTSAEVSAPMSVVPNSPSIASEIETITASEGTSTDSHVHNVDSAHPFTVIESII
jgi:hypothetical protein